MAPMLALAALPRCTLCRISAPCCLSACIIRSGTLRVRRVLVSAPDDDLAAFPRCTFCRISAPCCLSACSMRSGTLSASIPCFRGLLAVFGLAAISPTLLSFAFASSALEGSTDGRGG